MTEIDFYQLIKWILIVLFAGFIGQFGKSLATFLMKKTRVSKTPNPTSTDPTKGLAKEPKEMTPEAPPPPESKESKDKAEKKAAKTLVKLRKKEAKQ